jgi:hypothetical protein
MQNRSGDSRRPAVILGLFLFMLIFPKEGFVTSAGMKVVRQFKGYSVSCTIPTRGNPSETEIRNAREACEKSLNASSERLARAFSHFARGHHPYDRYRSVLLPEVTFSMKDGEANVWTTSDVTIDGLEVTLFVKPKSSDAVRTKIRDDFLLAQVSPGGIFQEAESRTTDGRPSDVVLFAGLHDAQTVEYAVRSRERILARIGAADLSPESKPVLQAVLLVLDGKPFPETLVNLALKLPKGLRDDVLIALVRMSTGKDRAQLSRLVQGISEERRWNYLDLLK